jgi:hypothetical protein
LGKTQQSHYISQWSVLSSAINEIPANDRKDRDLWANASMSAKKLLDLIQGNKEDTWIQTFFDHAYGFETKQILQQI